MPTYSIEFGAKLAEVAQYVASSSEQDIYAARVAMYVSRLSMEVSLKALLERAGVPVAEIRARSHCLSGLLDDLGRCEVQVEATPQLRAWAPASRLRSVTLAVEGGATTVGAVLDAEAKGASQYPNQIRYGTKLVDYPPVVLAAAAASVVVWGRQHWEGIRATERPE
jgi:hypothetical protein